MHLMDGENIAAGLARYPSADRIGFARLTTMAFEGADLRPLRDQLIGRLADGTAGAGEGLDLSLIAQLLGDKKTGMAMQAEVLAFHQLYRSPCSSQQPKLRVLALAAAIDMGGNTPIEFLLENSGIELQTLYVVGGVDLPMPLPEHDVAIVIASDSEECLEALRKIDSIAPRWPDGDRPIAARYFQCRARFEISGHRTAARFACRRRAGQGRRWRGDDAISFRSE
jgi:hypothetical protein